MKRYYALLAVMVVVLNAFAQRIQVVDVNGLPIAAVDQLFDISQED